MDPQSLSPPHFWPSVAAIALAVFTPLVIWCIYVYRIRQITARSMIGLVAAEVLALIAIAILARF
ncbi:MAG TPA: hypothetical protein VMV10_31615 [Pirellulales bacterium]|nr:hypothetical protein [Pirellulales bacterium]